jgi:hypothetical protein
VPTRFKNASTVGSPQYPAAIAAGIRRGQEPAGIMAERGIANRSEDGCQKVGRERLRSLVWLMVHAQITNNAWKDTIRQIVEEDSAAY